MRRPPADSLPANRTPAEEREALLTYAYRALAARALTEAELRTRLQRRTSDHELVEQVLARVQELGFQDDTQVAQQEGARRQVGAIRVRHTLRRRGVQDALIQQTLDARSPEQEQEAALDLLRRRWPALSRKRDPKAAAYALLARRGFPSAVIWAVIREVLPATARDDSAELDLIDEE